MRPVRLRSLVPSGVELHPAVGPSDDGEHVLGRGRDGKHHSRNGESERTTPSNDGMKLRKLSAEPTLAPQAVLGRSRRRMPAPSRSNAGTASQLIPGVRWTCVQGVRGDRMRDGKHDLQGTKS